MYVLCELFPLPARLQDFLIADFFLSGLVYVNYFHTKGELEDNFQVN